LHPVFAATYPRKRSPIFGSIVTSFQAAFRRSQLSLRLWCRGLLHRASSLQSSSAPMAIRSMRCSFSMVVFVGVSLVCQRVAGQSKPISLAYQITHVDNATPALSPDGKRMIYESAIDGKEQLFAMDLDGSNSIQLTHAPNGHEDPAWSPNGQKVALVSDENDFQVIYVMNPDGTGMSRLTDKDSHTIQTAHRIARKSSIVPVTISTLRKRILLRYTVSISKQKTLCV